MCDTIYAPADRSDGRIALFGKNSDRQRNEAQGIELHPARQHDDGAALACTYLTIAQARRTNAVLLSRPFWIWGAEMGANEHGVVIGNEAQTARSPSPREKALMGMDLVRLGLERGASAREALSVMTGLLERHGQGGDCGHLTPNFYNNGFIIADRDEAFVLETIGRDWMAERLTDRRALSNTYSIVTPDLMSAGLVPMIEREGWSSGAPEDFGAVVADPEREHIGQAQARRRLAESLLGAAGERLSARDFMAVLRDHRAAGQSVGHWDPRTFDCYGLCVHAGAAEKPGQTTGAMVSQLGPASATHWVTGSSSPCLSVFKPVLMDAPLPDLGPAPSGTFDPKTLWWRHEVLHRRAALGDLPGFLREIEAERDGLEAAFLDRIGAVATGTRAERAEVVAACWAEALAMESRWAEALETSKASAAPGAYEEGWRVMNEAAAVQGAL